MSSRSLFVIILRILGILTVRTAFLALFQAIGSLFLMGGLNEGRFMYPNVVSYMIATAIYFAVSWVLIFKAGYIVDRFKLSQDITPVLQFKIDTRDVLRIALVVVGALLIIYELPAFISGIADKLDAQESVLYDSGNSITWRPVILSGIQMVIGLLIIGERKRILDALLKDPANNPTDEDLQQPAEEESKDLFPEQQ